ncbi:MAG TPA: hypothetical protein VD886_26675 [Herpetosiphonaceae bacterium]|nr:hypothetical protein [Herpetosiphonaceae bacterium]
MSDTILLFKGYLGSIMRSKYTKYINTLVNVILFALVSSLIYQNRDQISQFKDIVDLQNIALCLFCYAIAYILQFFIWAGLMGNHAGGRVNALRDYVNTTLMGRLPGSVWKILGRVTIYKTNTISSRTVVLINLTEMLVIGLGNAIMLILLGSWHVAYRISLLALALAILLVAKRVNKPYLSRDKNRIWHWSWWLACAMGEWIAGGLFVYLLIHPFLVLAQASISVLAVIVIWCRVGAAGLLLQIVPLGSFFRDATLVIFLQSVMPLSHALIAATVVRLGLLIADVAVGWLFLIASSRHKRPLPAAE